MKKTKKKNPLHKPYEVIVCRIIFCIASQLGAISSNLRMPEKTTTNTGHSQAEKNLRVVQVESRILPFL